MSRSPGQAGIESGPQSGYCTAMSVNEILQEMDRLSPDELKVIREKLDLLHQDFEATPEMLAAIEEGIRSLREEKTITLEELREEMRTWSTDSK